MKIDINTVFVNVGTTHITNKCCPLNEKNGKTAAIVLSIALGVFTGLGVYFAASLKATALATFTVMAINKWIGGPTVPDEIAPPAFGGGSGGGSCSSSASYYGSCSSSSSGYIDKPDSKEVAYRESKGRPV